MKKNLNADYRLKPSELNTLSNCLGCTITSFRIQRPEVTSHPQLWIENIGYCELELLNSKDGLRYELRLTSTFQERPPLADMGGIEVALKEKIVLPLAERLARAPELTEVDYSVVPFYHGEDSPIQVIEFYGEQLSGKLGDIYPEDVFADSSDAVRVEASSLEYLVIVYAGGNRTVISAKEGGFFYHLLVDEAEYTKAHQAGDYAMEVNGYRKQIVLQHRISG